MNTDYVHNRERKVLCLYCLPSVFNSIYNNGANRMEIWKGIRNTAVPVCVVSVRSSKIADEHQLGQK